MNSSHKIAFFGTPRFAELSLLELEKRGVIPAVVIAGPDKPKGRKLLLTPPETKIWATERNIPVLQPEKLSDEKFQNELRNFECDLFIVSAYGKIIPKTLLGMPPRGIVNIHPSLLPRLRGASPLQSAILRENETGVSIIRLDEEMDHGPILAQKSVHIAWPPKYSVLEKISAETGAELIAELIDTGKIDGSSAKEQNHSLATFTKKIQKEDGLLDFSETPETNLRKIRAFEEWPRAYFFDENGKRIIATDAEIEDGKLVLKKIIPEGGKEIPFADYKKNRSA